MHVVILYCIIFILAGLFSASVFSIRALLNKTDYYEDLFLSLEEQSTTYVEVLKDLSETDILYDNEEIKILMRTTNNFIGFLEAYEWIKEEEEEA